MDWSSSGRADRFEYTRVSAKSFEDMETLDVVSDGGTVTYNDLTTTKVSAELPLLYRLDIGNDYLRVYSISEFDGESVRIAHATLMPSSPTYTLTSKRGFNGASVQGTAKLYSLLHVLEEVAVDVPLSIDAGTLAVDYAMSLVVLAGLDVQSDASMSKLTAPAIFDAGTTYMEIINWLLDYAGFRSASVDGYGTVQFRRYVDPSALSPVVVFRDGEGCVFFEGVAHELDLFDVPNKIIVVMTNEDATMTGIAINDDPASRYSTVGRGRVITRVETVTQAESQEALDDMAASALRQATSAVESVEVEHVYVPFEMGQAGQLIYTQADTDFIGVAVSQTLTLTPGMPSKTRFRRFVRM
jgi:hypothetical protein